MSHEEFVAAFTAGRVWVQVDRAAAARLVSARMLLPIFLLPVLGVAIAVALIGYLWWGVAIFVLALAFRWFVRRSAQGFVVQQALQDAAFYRQALEAGVIKVSDRP